MEEKEVPSLFISGGFLRLAAYRVENGVTFFSPLEAPDRIDMITGSTWIKNAVGVAYNDKAIVDALFESALEMVNV